MTLRAIDDQFLWEEKYRPQTIDDCILPESIKKTFKDYVKQGQLPTFLLDGTAGVGKTTIAKALCNEIGAEYLFINGSDEGRSIDILRTTIKGFASSVSLTDQPKVVIIDEADYMNAQSVQPALRSFIEEYSSNCRFIFTCNYKNKIIEPLRSRCTIVDFRIDRTQKTEMAAQFFKRATQILKQEGVEFESKVVAEIITKYFPDYRKVLKELQRYSVSGKIDSGILVNLSEESYKELFKLMKEKNWKEVRSWVAKNADNDPQVLFREFYDNANNIIEQNSIPALVDILGDYDYRLAFVADKEITIMCAMTSIMRDCKFK
jgi:DNA polymerase III delta prime subunit